MPRISTLTFTKDYQTVAEAFKDMLKNPVVTEREEEIGAGKPAKVIEIEGDFEHFVLEDMDMWGGRLKVEIKDFRIQDEVDREMRSMLAQGMPGYGSVLFSPTIAFVFKRVTTTICTTTITEKIRDGQVIDRKEEVQSEEIEEWEEITREFGQKVHIKP